MFISSICHRGISHSLTTESCRLTSRFHIYRKFVSPEVDKRQLAVHATIARYEYLWPIMQSTKNDLLILDIDLSFKHINLCSLIDNTQHQQEIMQRFLLTYGSLIADYQSNISAGMLFASTHHCHIYNQISSILASLPKEACLWGIDQALIIQVLAETIYSQLPSITFLRFLLIIRCGLLILNCSLLKVSYVLD